MAQRHKDAVGIQLGAVNPIAITGAIQRAFKEIESEPNFQGTKSLTHDCAVRLMIHQLSFICEVGEMDHFSGGKGEKEKLNYSHTTSECERLAKE